MIGICGMGGAGKTTVARAIYDNISIFYEGISFVENVREGSKGMGLKELQRQILSAVLNDRNINVEGVSDGKNMMKRMMPHRKVLVVLDDVDDISQLEALAGNPNWFKLGSRFIITTRDKQVLIAQGVHVDNIYNTNLLSREEAICLFCRCAFRTEFPIQGYEELSEKVVHYAAGLPLTIKVLGSFLCGRTRSIWLDTLNRLKTIPLEDTLKKLEISYDGLEKDYQEIFLDVACILKSEQKNKAIRILESCGFPAQIGLEVLEQKSLINISSYGYLAIHDHIEKMGRNIVRRLHPCEPNRHSRLWVKEEIEEILLNDLGTKAIKSMILKYTDIHPAIIMKGLRKMKKIIFLSVNRYLGHKMLKIDEGDVQYLPDTLRYLCWTGYPLFCLPKTFQANELVYLKMPGSCISQLWKNGERKVLKKLKFVDLSYSKLRTFDLGMTRNLETLDLRSCIDLVELQIPIPLPMLKVLDLSGSKVSNLNLGMTPNIENLCLKRCEDLVELQMSVALPMLKCLYLSHSKVSNLNLGLTPDLKVLKLKDCYYLQEIHAPVGCLKNLTRLNLSGCLRFEYVRVNTQHFSPCVDSLAKLELIAESLDRCPLHPSSNLPKFKFQCEYGEVLPSSSGNLEKLLSFGLCACTDLESFSTSICGLQNLVTLKLEGSIPEVPKDLRKLESLEQLTLSMKEIKHLPDNICMLKHLKSLDLKSCEHLEQLPMDLGGLECLEELHLTDCVYLRDIPDSICKMKFLKDLHLTYCIQVKKLPEELGRIECLKLLNIEGAGISRLPESIFQLKDLRIIGSTWQLKSYGFTSVTEISTNIASCYIGDYLASNL